MINTHDINLTIQIFLKYFLLFIKTLQIYTLTTRESECYLT